MFRIYLVDKQSGISIAKGNAFLSDRAIVRRSRYQIPIDEKDLPVSKAYLDSIVGIGLKIICTSRWMNTVLVSGMDSAKYERLKQFGFVRQIRQVADTLHKTMAKSRKFNIEYHSSYTSVPTWRQIELNNGYFLHEKGYRGKGVWIGIIDAGFKQAYDCLSLQTIYSEGRIIATRDFVRPDSGIYTGSYHGTAVLSVMAAWGTDSLLGTAPAATYLLLKSEDVYAEYPAEEDFWVAAAEYADSIGVDIINTSLGYTTFDNSDYNYSYSDMNGATTFISQAASIAASKGMLIVVSAGNEGDDKWHYISAPADAKGIIAVGAIDENGMRALFSSAGPSSDGRIKPEVMAMGKGVRAEYAPAYFRPVSGTSFSAPVITGLAACLWEAFRDKSSATIREAIIRSSSLYSIPDTLMGYGIPDFFVAYNWLMQYKSNSNNFALYPNPCREKLSVEWYNPDKAKVSITCINILGQVFFRKISNEPHCQELDQEISFLPSGTYILQLVGPQGFANLKFVKF
ncbi:MAG: S8 family serine peptidase [Bacteroidales bacterium]|nr:S8 family serine peptidase [Bacteroidales bacterium]